MVRAWLVVAGALVGLLSSGGGICQAQDKIIGAIWEVRVKPANKDQYESRGVFRCTLDGKVYRDGKLVGSHKNMSWEVVEIKIDKLGVNWNGTLKAKRVAKDGAIWEGVARRDRGDEMPVRLFLKAD